MRSLQDRVFDNFKGIQYVIWETHQEIDGKPIDGKPIKK